MSATNEAETHSTTDKDVVVPQNDSNNNDNNRNNRNTNKGIHLYLYPGTHR